MNLIERLRSHAEALEQTPDPLVYFAKIRDMREAAAALEQVNALLQEVLAADDEGGKWFNAWQTLEWRIHAYLATQEDKRE